METDDESSFVGSYGLVDFSKYIFDVVVICMCV